MAPFISAPFVSLVDISTSAPGLEERITDALRQIAGQATGLWQAAETWTIHHFAQSPAFMVGLAVVVLLPLLTLFSGFIGRLTLPATRSPTAAMHASHLTPANATRLSAVPQAPIAVQAPREGWLVADGPPQVKFPVKRELISLGREDDSDVVFNDETVHRFHAVIQRRDEAVFIIRDMAGPDGNGVYVNGERVTEAALVDGDVIRLGLTQLRFHARDLGGVLIDEATQRTAG